jgi:hypothetical protein
MAMDRRARTRAWIWYLLHWVSIRSPIQVEKIARIWCDICTFSIIARFANLKAPTMRTFLPVLAHRRVVVNPTKCATRNNKYTDITP